VALDAEHMLGAGEMSAALRVPHPTDDRPHPVVSDGCPSLADEERIGRAARSVKLFETHAFNVITVQHLDRLLGGELLAAGPRLDWARLMRRTLGFDPLECAHCGHRLRPLAEITERRTIDKILAAVGYERRSPPRARAPARTHPPSGPVPAPS